MGFLFILVRYSLYFLTATALVIVLQILVHRLLVTARERRNAIEYARLEQGLLAVLSSPHREEAVRFAVDKGAAPRRREVLTQLLIDYARVLGGEDREKLRLIFEAGLRREFLRDLRSRLFRRRLRAARLFGLFIGPGEVPAIVRLLRDRPDIRLAAVHAISQVARDQAVDIVFKAFAAEKDENCHTYANVFFRLGLRAERHIREALRAGLSTVKRGHLIEVAGAIPLPGLAAEIASFASDPEKEIRIRVARALGGLMLPEGASILARMVHDDAWEVRAQAVKSIGRLAVPGAADLLANCLKSRIWHVRLNACQALLGLGEEGVRRLRAMLLQKDDRFAADIALMGLEGLSESPSEGPR